jgi:hypothetical protein
MRFGFPIKTLAAAVTLLGVTQPASAEATFMKIRMAIDGRSVQATLHDNAAARELASMLPLTLSLEDYAATEKIAYLPRKLAASGRARRDAGSRGEIAYYAPWGNLAIFYKDFKYSPGLISLGRVDSGLEILTARAGAKVTIERADQ